MANAYDLQSELNLGNALDFIDITSDTTTVGNIIDTLGADLTESNAIAVISATLTDGAYEVQLFEDDLANMSTETQVTNTDDIVGTIPSFTAAEDDTLKQFGYVGSKRFLRIKIVSTGTTSGGPFNAVFGLGNKRHAGDQ